jgi:hypothetical protein
MVNFNLLKFSKLLKLVKKQNLENFYPRRKRTGHYKIFSFGSGFALFMEPTQQAAGYSAPLNKRCQQGKGSNPDSAAHTYL